MLITNSGSLSLTNGSSTVTGAGTSFKADLWDGASVLVIDGRLYVVETIESETSLTLSNAWPGATASGVDYEGFIVENVAKDLLRKTVDLLQTFGPLRGSAEEFSALIAEKAVEAAASAAAASTSATQAHNYAIDAMNERNAAATIKSDTQTLRDATEALRVTTEGYKNTTVDARDAGILARDVTLGYRNEALAFRDAAAASFNNFNDNYLGRKATAPTVDNDGDPLQEGALYYRTSTSRGMYVWSGTAWEAAYVDGNMYVAKAGGTMTGVLTAPGIVVDSPAAEKIQMKGNNTPMLAGYNAAGTQLGFIQFDATNTYLGHSGTGSVNLFSNGAAVLTANSLGAAITGNLAATGKLILQRGTSSLNLTVAQYWNGTGTPLSGPKGDILAIGNQGGDGLVLVNGDVERLRLTTTGASINGDVYVGGNLDLNTAAPLKIRLRGASNSYIDFSNTSGSRIGYLQGLDGTGMILNADAGLIRLSVAATVGGPATKIVDVTNTGIAVAGDVQVGTTSNIVYSNNFGSVSSSADTKFINNAKWHWEKSNGTRLATLDDAGSLALGTTSPLGKIHVNNLGSVVTSIVAGNANGGAIYGVDSAGNVQMGTYAGAAVRIGNYATGTSLSTEYARFTNTGRLGIGTIAPAYPLDVNGQVRARSVNIIKDPSGTATAMNAYISLQDAADSERGWIGFGSGTTAMTMRNAVGPIAFHASGSQALLVTSTGLTATGNITATANVTAAGFYQSTYTGFYKPTSTLVDLSFDNGDVHRFDQSANQYQWYVAGNNIALLSATNFTCPAIATSGAMVGTASDAFNARFAVYNSGANVATFNNTGGSAQANVIMRHAGAAGATAAYQIMFCNDVNSSIGAIQSNGTSTAYLTSSDRRLKQNIGPASPAGDIIDAMQIVEFDFTAGNHVTHGVIAQDLHEVFPDAVSVGDDAEDGEKQRPWSVDPSKAVWLLVKEVQALRARAEAAESRLSELEDGR